MTTGYCQEQLDKLKIEATDILERGKFPVHKWEFDIKELEGDGMQNRSKILGYKWDKENGSIEIQVTKQTNSEIITKRSVMSMFWSIYHQLRLMSPTIAEGKSINRKACEERSQ